MTRERENALPNIHSQGSIKRIFYAEKKSRIACSAAVIYEFMATTDDALS